MMPYEKLQAWEKCHELALAVYLVTRNWPREELYGLTSQARRSAFSAAANLAEGSAKSGPKEFRRFLNISLGSLSELSYIIRLARDLGITAEADSVNLERLREAASKLTWGLYDYVKKKSLRRE